MPTRIHREAVLRRERELYARGPMTRQERAAFESAKARVAAEDERRRQPEPQLELQAVA